MKIKLPSGVVKATPKTSKEAKPTTLDLVSRIEELLKKTIRTTEVR